MKQVDLNVNFLKYRNVNEIITLKNLEHLGLLRQHIASLQLTVFKNIDNDNGGIMLFEEFLSNKNLVFKKQKGGDTHYITSLLKCGLAKDHQPK